jgi:hypothetical protein
MKEKKLIIKLAESIDNNHKKKFDFSSCFGVWKDEQNADEISEDIRLGRVNNQELD